jgi:hypothetical protein
MLRNPPRDVLETSRQKAEQIYKTPRCLLLSSYFVFPTHIPVALKLYAREADKEFQ